MGQFVAVSPDGQVVGAAYTQRVASQDSLLAITRDRELSLHTPHGRVVQLLGVVQMPAANVSDQLRRYVLHCSGLDATVDEVCVVARCRSFDPSVHGASRAAYQAHVDACTDPELLLHTSAGACIFGLVAGYRVADTANLGYGVIVTYGLSSAPVGRHLASTPVRSAAPLDSGVGTPGSLAIRRATARDIAGLVKLEASRQHPALLAASEGTIRQRIEAHPMGQFVAVSPDGQVVGAAYTQRVASQDSLLAITRDRELSLHTPHGRVVQLLGVVQMPAANVSDQLRRYVLHCSGLDATVDEVCVVARCRSFDPSVHGASRAAYQAHVDACTDPELLLHTSAGACIFGLVAGYRVADTANLGYGVIVTYGLSSAPVGRHLASTPVRSAAPLDSGVGTPGSLAIRRATARDIAGLVKLEASRQHPALLAASEGTIRQRIEAHPMGQFVAVSPDGQVVGAAYTQRVASQDSLLAITRDRELSLHTPHGRVVQLLGVVQMPAANVSDQLRRYVLHCSGLDATVDEVCVVARCRSFDPSVHGASRAAYQAHVDACTDPELLLHTSAGACIFGLVAGYRVADTANLGYGVIVTYGLSSAPAGRHLASTPVRSAAEVRRALTFARSPPGSERLLFEQVEEQQPPGWPRHLQSRGQQHLVASSARWPGSATTSFAFLPAGGDAVGQIPSQRWGVADSPVPAGRFGAFLSHAERFAAAFFGVSAAETSATDPQQRLLLEHGYAALHSTHERRESLRAADVGVFLGIMNADFASIYVESGSVYAATGGTISIAAGRLSFVLGTQGPVASYDTACSSGLVASHAAFGAARAGECASSLVLAVSLMLSPQVRKPHPLLPL